jgi:pyruvate kinase
MPSDTLPSHAEFEREFIGRSCWAPGWFRTLDSVSRNIGDALREVEELRSMVCRATQGRTDRGDVHASHRPSVDNLDHFVAMRSCDLRQLQDDLAALGLSSLGRSEAHVLATLDAVLRALRSLAGEAAPIDDEPSAGFASGPRLLERKTHALLGPTPKGRTTRIMVTLPSAAADSPEMIDRFVQVGMDVARINCAHDDPLAWTRMAEFVRAAGEHNGRDVRVLMDLAGPKLRTGPMSPGPAVVKIKPRRDVFGRVLVPGRAVLVPAAVALDERHDGLPVIPVDRVLFDNLRSGMVLHLRDARDADRSIVVVDTDERDMGVADAVVVEAARTTYVTSGMTLESDHPTAFGGTVGTLPPSPGYLRLSVGHVIELVGNEVAGEMLSANRARVGCTLPEAVTALQPGHRVFLDDGAFEGVVEEAWVGSVGPPTAVVRITSAPPTGGKLKAQKGINVPDTDIPVPALTERDIRDLDTATRLADIVALSFVREPDDVVVLQRELAARDADDLGIVLKIETVQGFRHLPQILRTAMRTERVGVMIARGDLAVEAGYERLAEVQEEILWLCEAAHLPVIWATEVLDNLAKTGRPSRSEITDAAMSERAECVMLNKGPYIVDAMLTLHDILHRMTEHQTKKRQLLRPLRSWTAAGPG